MTRKMTPMQDSANMPRDVMRHVRERKHASTVYQFQSMEILHESPLSPMDMLDVDVADAIAVEAVGSSRCYLWDDQKRTIPGAVLTRTLK